MTIGRAGAWGVAALLLWTLVFWSGPLINDVAWQLWIGARLNDGAQLYRDILEVNPPLWFWIGAAAEGLASRTGLSGVHVLGLAFLAYGLLSLSIALRLSRSRDEEWAIGGALAASLFLTSPYAHLQREQFVLMAVLPYIVLAARRAERAEVPAGWAFAVGLLAAPGLALKHHFLLLPLLVEAWLWWRRGRPSVRPELIALVLAALAYAAAVLTVTPTYLSTMLPLLRAAYHGYNPALTELLSQPAFVVAAFALLAAFLGRKLLPVLASAGAVGTAAFALAFLWQGKNFHYQAIPALGLGLLTIISLLIASWRHKQDEGRLAALVGLVAALAVPFIAGGSRHDQVFLEATAEVPRGQAVEMVSASQALSWPAVYERGLGWPSRTMGLWMVLSPWKAEIEGPSSPAMTRLGTAVRREMAAEIGCDRPAMVVVDTRYDEHAPGKDMLAWFKAEPRFAAALAGYREVPRTGFLRRFVPLAGARPACVPADRHAMTHLELGS